MDKDEFSINSVEHINPNKLTPDVFSNLSIYVIQNVPLFAIIFNRSQFYANKSMTQKMHKYHMVKSHIIFKFLILFSMVKHMQRKTKM